MTALSTPGYIHFRVHSAYSLLEGALPVKLLAKLAAKEPSLRWPRPTATPSSTII